ncbi:sugar phosphate isomerase/epimerase family protein [Halalkalibacter alkaliphilus]|uniref:Sugar phosphate isomerase/epimerase n=1 Tax=Halalkalibacter alkaliphilus TaxID=2917993 RepID=A0A9X1ZVV1_9BACI|nr:sugar phosphate isomerase/epimerase [Halalkalibacter alkaliphilus]MCL7745593.1 sugar phosphate isomerase/epimerase [Halalkalibacter alkaliphilus]
MRFAKYRDQMIEVQAYTPGIQLYSVREEFRHDPFRTLKALVEMGYQTVEFAGYNEIPAFTMSGYLQKLGLRAPASHVPLERLEEDLEGEITYAKRVGIQYIVIPMIERNVFYDAKLYREVVHTVKWIGEQVKKHRLQLVYHNHEHEFERLPGGHLIIDRFLHDVGVDLIQLELDLFWVRYAGFDPVATLQKYRGNVPLIHVKDMDEAGQTTEVGKGVINYRPVFPILADVGVKYYFVEQEHFERTPLESVEMSLDYLRSVGLV